MEKDNNNIKQLMDCITSKLEDAKVPVSTRNEMYIITIDGEVSSMDDMLRGMSSELATSQELYATVVLFRTMQATANYPAQNLAAMRELERALDANDLYVYTKRQALYEVFGYMTFVMRLEAKTLNATFASVHEVITSIYDNGGFIAIDRKSR